jgi:NhaA family Na+:H+ antiporter
MAASEPVRELRPWPLVGLMALSMAAAYAGRVRHIRTPWFYLLTAGTLSWMGLYLGGAPPALAPLAVVPFVPARRTDPGFFIDAVETATAPLDRLELVCRHPAQIALFLFGVVNAGVPVTSLETGVLALPLAALLGRPAGALAGVVAARAIGLHLPAGLRARELVVLGFTTAVGFTMTLFLAGAVLGPGQILAELSAGALLSLVAAVVAVAMARVLHVGRFATPATRSS